MTRLSEASGNGQFDGLPNSLHAHLHGSAHGCPPARDLTCDRNDASGGTVTVLWRDEPWASGQRKRYLASLEPSVLRAVPIPAPLPTVAAVQARPATAGADGLAAGGDPS